MIANIRWILAASLMALALIAGVPAAEAAPAEEPAAGAAGAHEGPAGVIPTIKQGLVPMITSLVVFGIVFFILSTKVWPRITKGLADREQKILQEISAAEEARRQAREALESYERSLAEARAEAQKMLEQTRAQQQAMAADLKSKADVELNQMRERAMRDIESAKKAALSEIYTQATGLATLMAGKILQREVGDSDHQRLVEESLAELRTARN